MFAGNAKFVVAIGLLLAGCRGDASPTTPSADAELAIALCGALREQTNTLVRIANGSVAGIAEKSPPDRTAAILDGFDEARRAAASFERTVPSLELPDAPESERLREEVAAGASAALEEIDDERAVFATEVPTVADDDVAGRVGQFFTSLEKVMSVVEPAIADYDRRALQEAFLDEPSCRNVVQPFRLGD